MSDFLVASVIVFLQTLYDHHLHIIFCQTQTQRIMLCRLQSKFETRMFADQDDVDNFVLQHSKEIKKSENVNRNALFTVCNPSTHFLNHTVDLQYFYTTTTLVVQK